MDTIIVIFNMVPEGITVYQFDNPEQNVREQLLACHNQYGNMVGSDDALAEWLSGFLGDHPDKMIFSDKQGDPKNSPKPFSIPQGFVVVTGFMS